MFCCLFLLNSGTKITGFEKESCFPECKYYSKSDSKCSIMNYCETPLTTNKYGWMIHLRIKFPSDFTAYLGTLKSALLLVHPSEQDIWINQCVKNDKNVYKAYISKKQIDFVNLNALNVYLASKGFDCRKLTEADF